MHDIHTKADTEKTLRGAYKCYIICVDIVRFPAEMVGKIPPYQRHHHLIDCQGYRD